jgi:signal peptidase I
MMPTLMSGDFILAEKVSYGARIFTNVKFGKNKEPSFIRTLALAHIKRGDIVIFNFPFREFNDTIRMKLDMYLIKRCIGIAGDTLSIVNGDYFIAGRANKVSYIHKLEQSNKFIVDSDLSLCIFPFDSTLHWNDINWGPLYIPSTGATIELTPHNFKLYRQLIVYETQSSVFVLDSSVYINGKHKTSYTFRYNWYFMAGDNIMNSQDSRHFGLIPEHYIISRVFMLISSRNNIGKRNFKRIMRHIK